MTFLYKTPQEESSTGAKFNLPPRQCGRISLFHLSAATNNFAKSFVIGEGGFAMVYKGDLHYEGRVVTVAIKRHLHNSPEFRNKFEEEILMVSEFRHRNLVSLIGFCDDFGETILVYEYMDGGTLQENLRKSSENNVPLSWLECLQICICAARALDYLHSGKEVIHRDVKSSNILLDVNRKIAKMSDFGISKIRPEPGTGASTQIRGTPGYVDPVYASTGDISFMSDVYSFGVVLVEVLCGRPAVDRTLPTNNPNLASWARSFIERRKVAQIVDPRLKSQISRSSLSEFVKVAYECLHSNPDDRPSMSIVLAGLELALKNQEQESQAQESVAALQYHALKKQERGKGIATKFGPAGIKKLIKNNSVSFPQAPRPKSAEAATNNTVDAPTDIGLVVVSPVQRDEFIEITNNFGAKFLMCEGTYANLYRCFLKSGKASFIRKLGFNAFSDKEFFAQVSMVSKLQHENVVKLLSYCGDDSLRVLAYEFTQKGSLYDILHGQKGAQQVRVLSWPRRVKIAVGSAKGLEYLHQGCSNPSIHCEITSRNILLFDDYVPKIADFNLPSKVGDMSASHTSDRFLLFSFENDTPVYEVVEQSSRDVYCFGEVLLELLTGRRHGDYKLPFAEQHLVKWAIPKLRGDKLNQCMDPLLRGRFPFLQAAEMAGIAYLCLQDEPTVRPSMRVVVEKLSRLLTDLPGASSNAPERA